MAQREKIVEMVVQREEFKEELEMVEIIALGKREKMMRSWHREIVRQSLTCPNHCPLHRLEV